MKQAKRSHSSIKLNVVKRRGESHSQKKRMEAESFSQIEIFCGESFLYTVKVKQTRKSKETQNKRQMKRT